MNTTTTINPDNSGNSSSNDRKKAAAFAATATGAAGLGVMGSHIASELGESEEYGILNETIEESTQPNNETPIANTTSASTPTTASDPSSVTSNTTSTSSTTEPQSITNDDFVESSVSVEPTIEPASEVETEVTVETEPVEPTIEPASEVGTEVTEETEPVEMTNTTTNEAVNPDEIAEAIIAEDKIDPNDIDMADVINFDEIGTVYTVDGESYTAAAFHDAAGNNLVMVDVDGDNVFDVITDYDGNLIAQIPGNLSVGDAQEDIAEDDVYLAYDNEMDNVDEYGDDSLADDLMA